MLLLCCDASDTVFGTMCLCIVYRSCFAVRLFSCSFFFFKQKTAYEMLRSLVGSEMCIRDRVMVDADGVHHLRPATCLRDDDVSVAAHARQVVDLSLIHI